MTQHQVNDLASSFVAMAQAYEELPKVHEALKVERDTLNIANGTIVSLQADLTQAKDYAASLELKVRETEAARDDAELRFLEADDRVSAFRHSAEACLSTLGRALAAVTGDGADAFLRLTGDEHREYLLWQEGQRIAVQMAAEAAKMVPLSDTTTDLGESSSASSDTPQATGEIGSTQEAGEGPLDVAHNPSGGSASNPEDVPPQGSVQSPIEPVSHASTSSWAGESATDPTASSASTEPMAASSTTAEGEASASQESPGSHKPYLGKLYHDHPYYVSLAGWLAGGGTEHDYYYRRPSVG